MSTNHQIKSNNAPYNLLLVEDNSADAVLIKEYIGEFETFEAQLHWVERLSEAFQFVHESNVDAILLDLGLPDSKGYATFEQMYRRCLKTPIIILTGFEDHDLAARAVRSGAQDFLVKGLVDSNSLNKSVKYAIERKRAQEALQESERKLATLMSNLPGMAYRCNNDKHWTIQYASEGVKKLTGYLPEELIDNKVVDYSSLIHKDDTDRVWKEVQKSLNQGTIFRLIYRITTKENIMKWVWEQGSAVYDDEGRLIALEGFITDISEQIEYQNKLRKFSAAVNQAEMMICITNTEGVVEYVNPSFVNGTGFTFKEVFGAKIGKVKIVENNPDFFTQVLNEIVAGNVTKNKIQSHKKEGELYWEQISVSPIYDDSGQVTHALFIGSDITNEIETEQQLIDADKMSAIGLLAAGVAHEFKNYLGGIIGYASFAESSMEKDKSGEIIKDTLKQIIEIGERANEVAMSLLTYSKVKSDIKTQHDIIDIVSKTLELFSRELKSNQIKLETDIERVPKIKMSPGRIQQVLLNLLINAKDAIDRHGIIKLSVKLDGRVIVVNISDNGVGIAPKNVKKIFDPFYSTKGVWGKDQLVGTGMGLAVSRNIARDHGGDLTVESKVGIGSTFILTLPIPIEAEIENPDTKPDKIIDDCKNVAVLSMNSNVFAKYKRENKKFDCRIIEINTHTKMSKALSEGVNLLLADAKYSAKVEFHNMIEECSKLSIPFMMINCGAMEYQLNDLYESAIGVYRDCPDLNQVLMQYRSLKISHSKSS